MVSSDLAFSPFNFTSTVLCSLNKFCYFGSVARIPSDCSSWIRCGPTKESGEERDHTVGKGGGDVRLACIPMLYWAGVYTEHGDYRCWLAILLCVIILILEVASLRFR